LGGAGLQSGVVNTEVGTLEWHWSRAGFCLDD
jgi:hypothetical protein